MSLDTLESSLRSLEGWKKGVGCFGGEPTLHPEFPAVCALFGQYFPKRQLAFWTCGGPAYERHRALIERTFGSITYNDHQSEGYHQPLMIAADEVVPDPVRRRELIEHCWIQQHWSPMITHRGAFFCEVAATFDNLFDGVGGFALEPGWWKEGRSDVAGQRERYCGSCSIPLPIEPVRDTFPVDFVSPGNAARLRAAGSPLALRGGIREVTSIDLDAAPTRNPRYFAMPGTPHYWSKMPLRMGFWMAAQYLSISSGPRAFLIDTARFSSLKVRSTANSFTRWARGRVR
jgi:hypothetical protein